MLLANYLDAGVDHHLMKQLNSSDMMRILYNFLDFFQYSEMTVHMNIYAYYSIPHTIFEDIRRKSSEARSKSIMKLRFLKIKNDGSIIATTPKLT